MANCKNLTRKMRGGDLNASKNKKKSLKNKVKNMGKRIGNSIMNIPMKAELAMMTIKNKYNSTFQKYGGKRRHRGGESNMSRGAVPAFLERSPYKSPYQKARNNVVVSQTMNWNGNRPKSLKNRLMPSNATKKQVRNALNRITPSKEKQNWLKNKAYKGLNLTRRGVKGVGRGVGKVVSGIASSPIIMGNMLASALT